MTERLKDKVAVVTGATSGIGLATAKRFVSEGAKVFITGRRPDVLEKAIAAIGGDVTGIQADSANLADLDRLFAEVKAKAGRIDVLFANAGGGSMLPLGEITEEHFDDTFNRNVKGCSSRCRRPCRCSARARRSSSPAPPPVPRARRTSASTAHPRRRFAISPATGSST